MKQQIKVFGKNKETQEQEVYELFIDPRNIACLYKDQYGVAITTKQGKFYRVDHSMKELEELL